MPRILVVDDEPDLVRLMQFRLEREGWEVVTAGDGQAALSSAMGDKPDLVVLDIMMPLLDGLEVLRQIRSHRATSKLPVIMLTAKTDLKSVDTARDLWIADYIMKPFDPEKLVQKVRKALKLPADS